MRVEEIMDRDLTPVESTSKARLAADLMDLKEVGALPVVEENRLVGLVTERDIAIRSESAERDPELCTVGEVMSESPPHCFNDDDVTTVGEKMKNAKIGCLPVLSSTDHQLIGLVTVSDIAKHYDKALAGEIIAAIS